jgi:hypothetical protein
MKSLTCELCGGNSLVKQGGMFVCEHCGTKYTPEEARKLMVEVSVNISGSRIKVDTSDELANLYQVARRARTSGDNENAERYYEMIYLRDPSSWEAYFYRIFYKAMRAYIEEIHNMSVEFINACVTTMKRILNHVPTRAERVRAVEEMTECCFIISNRFFNSVRADFAQMPQYLRDVNQAAMTSSANVARDILYRWGDTVEYYMDKYPELIAAKVEAWKQAVIDHVAMLPYYLNKKQNKEMIIDYEKKIRFYQPNYLPPVKIK